MNEFALLNTLRKLFEGTNYKHRDSSLGDLVAASTDRASAKPGERQVGCSSQAGHEHEDEEDGEARPTLLMARHSAHRVANASSWCE